MSFVQADGVKHSLSEQIIWMAVTCLYYFYSTDVGNREMEAVTQMREAVQMVETASLEKEQVNDKKFLLLLIFKFQKYVVHFTFMR